MLCFAVLAGIVSGASFGAPRCDVYVNATRHGAAAGPAPQGTSVVVQSLAEAQDEVRQRLARTSRRLESDLLVCLGAGTHSVVGGMSFEALDSPRPGHGRVVWRGLGTETAPAVVSGGAQVTGWKRSAFGGGQAFVAAVPPAAAGLPAIRQLWVAGIRANRSTIGTDVDCTACTTPNASAAIQCAPSSAEPQHLCPPAAPSCIGFHQGVQWGHCERCTCRSLNALPVFTPWVYNRGAGAPASVGFTTSEPLPAGWTRSPPGTIELVWPIVIRNWIEPRCTVASIVGTNVTLTSPCGQHLLSRHGGPPPAPVRIEAAPPIGAAALAPGAFYHDGAAKMLYYVLAPGQSAADLEASAVVAATETLAVHAGAHGQSWVDLQFSHSTWLQPNSPDGFVDNQATVFLCTPGSPSCNLGGAGEPLGAVRVAGSTDLSFTRCEFAHIGSPYALSVLGSSKRVAVGGCSFRELSGGFLKLGSVGADNTASNPAGWDEGFEVTHNVAHTQAVEYGGAPGYFGGFISHSTISHNTVSDAGYSGFSQGWGWGSTHAAGYGNVTLAYNRIFNVMTKMKDGGGIYVNGFTNDAYTNTIAHNWVNNDEHVFAVYYMDNGASHWHVTQNVASNSTGQWAFFMTPGTGIARNAAHNNTVDHLWMQGDADPVNGCAQYGCVVDNTTVFKVPTGQPLPAPALAIMAAAGATPDRLQ